MNYYDENATYLPPSDWTDSELLARMLEKEGRAWSEFHRRYDRLVYRCIHKVTGRFRSLVGSEDVREIHAQFMMNLTARDMHRLRAFAPERGNKLGSWIGLLATNTAWDYLRSLSRQPQCTDFADVTYVDASVPSPSEAMERKEALSLVNKLMLELSTKDRDFVRLYFVDGLSPEEVAEEMNISVKTVYSKKHKIRSRLEGVLAERTVRAEA